MNTLELAKMKQHLLQEIQEIKFKKGHADSYDLKRMCKFILRGDPFEDEDVVKKLDAIDAFNGYNPNYELRDVDQFSNIIKSKALDVVSDGSGPELLVLQSGRAGYTFAITNPNAPTIGEYFIGLIKATDIAEEYYSLSSLKNTMDLPALEIGWSIVANEWRGKGIGKTLYSLVFKWATSKGYGLASDSVLYDGSAGMWTTYLPEIAQYFGVVIKNIIIPISKEEAKLDKFKFFENASRFIAFNNPPKTLRKILYNTQGLSYSKGQIVINSLSEYSVNEPLDTNGEFDIFDYVEEHNSISELLKSLRKDVSYDSDLSSFFPFAKSQNSAQVAILLFSDVTVLVKTVSTGEEEVLPTTIKTKLGIDKPKMIKRLVAVTL
jgi:hypothetical protein